MALHRRLGVVYMSAVTVSAIAAYVIALSPSAGWVFGSGLMGLATAWLTTTGLAFLAIKRQLYDQHKEWMIRSYVVTFAFVFFRIGSTAIGALAPDSLLPGSRRWPGRAGHSRSWSPRRFFRGGRSSPSACRGGYLTVRQSRVVA
jgi:hypothetical protein